MQLAKISAALARLTPPVSVRLCPDRSHDGRNDRFVCHAGRPQHRRPGALIGFAGPRVIEQTSARSCPGFQRSEFLLEHGMLDAVVHRKGLKPYIARR